MWTKLRHSGRLVPQIILGNRIKPRYEPKWGGEDPFIPRTEEPTQGSATYILSTSSQLKAARKSIHIFQNNYKSIDSTLLQAALFPKTKSSNDSKEGKKKKKGERDLHHFTLPRIWIYSRQDSSKESQELKYKEKEEKAELRRKQKSWGTEAASKLEHTTQLTHLRLPIKKNSNAK